MRLAAASLLALAAACSEPPTQAAALDRILADKARAVFAAIPADGAGCAASVMKGGVVIWAEGFGLADIEAGRRIDADTVFNIASISKQFTGFSILLLESQGKLSRDDSIRKFLPELGTFADAVTIRHLLHHTGGLRDYTFTAGTHGIAVADKLSEKDGLEMIFRQSAPDFEPGTEESYSNTGYFLLSEIIQRTSGQTNADFAQASIFTPLGMTSTSIVDHYPTAMPALARGYTKDADGKYSINETGWEMTGDGQVHTTVRDMAKWQQNFIDKKVGGLAVDQLVTSGELNGKPLGYGAGIGVGEYRGARMVQHGGGWAGYNSDFLALTDLDIGAAVFCNTFGLDPDKRGRALIDIFAADSLGVGSKPDRSADVKPFVMKDAPPLKAGAYVSAQGGAFSISGAPADLSLDIRGEKRAITQVSPGLYKAGDDDDLFLAVSAPDAVRTTSNGLPFTRVGDKPDVGPLAAYVGAYASPDIGSPLVVTEIDGALIAKLGDMELALHPLAPGRFWSDNGILEFKDGQARLISPMIRDLRLVRQ